jgi:uncharacterized protein
MISKDDGKTLLKLARDAISSSFSKSRLEFPEGYDEKLGVFVTLKKEGMLRGCIGFPQPVHALKKAVAEAARAAAFEDPRFPPIESDDFGDIDIELSVLTLPVQLECDPEDYPKHIVIGKHGLIIRNMYNSGLLLPQVFTEHDCTPVKALEMVCQKAGLDPDEWKEPESIILTFEAMIFHE